MKMSITGVAFVALSVCISLDMFTGVASAVSTTGIVGNWHMDEERGQSVHDSSPYANHGRLGSTRGRDGDDPSWILRRFDTSALNFDYDYVSIRNHRRLEPAKITVEAWVRPVASAPTVLPYIVAKGLSAQNNYCAFASYALYLVGEEPVFYISDGTTYYSSPAGPDVVDGQWHHIVGTYDEQHIRIYVDGVESGSGTVSSVPINYSLFPVKKLIIGDADGTNGRCTDYNGFYSGDIDEVRIWDRALTASEVVERYQGD